VVISPHNIGAASGDKMASGILTTKWEGERLYSKYLSTIGLAAIGKGPTLRANHAVALLLETGCAGFTAAILVQTHFTLRINTNPVTGLDITPDGSLPIRVLIFLSLRYTFTNLAQRDYFKDKFRVGICMNIVNYLNYKHFYFKVHYTC
jgi:hypothetical protein